MASTDADRLVHTEEEQRAIDEELKRLNEETFKLFGKPLTVQDRIEKLWEALTYKGAPD